MIPPHAVEARQIWNKARRGAVWARLRSTLQGRDSHLVDFDATARQLRLQNAVYRGVKNIPLNEIVGSVGRYQDFTKGFLPRSEDMGERWRSVAAAVLNPSRSGLPPIEAYQVGKWYFVKDGNHRVSVARQLGATLIDAYVWEYTDALPPVEDVASLNIDALLIAAEQRDFLEATRMNEVRPDHDIQLSAPGGYTDMLGYIAQYQDALAKIDGAPVTYDEAVKAWYDMIYESACQLIRESGVMALFPERTTADFFIWIMRNQERLDRQYRRTLMVQDAAREYARRHPRGLLGWIRYLAGRLWATIWRR